MKNWLYNKTVIITGASGGLGFTLAKLLIEKYNCNVIGIARNEQKLISNAQLLGENKQKFSYKLFDVSVYENWVNFKNYLTQNNVTPDVLINNAGFMLPFSKFEGYTATDIERITSTNFLSVTYAVKELLPLIKQSNTPAIINVSSASALCAVVGQSMYTATKFALRGLTDTLRVENKGVYVAGIYPGFIKTDIFGKTEFDEKTKKLLDKFMMPVDKAGKKIVRQISKKRKNVVIGFDGKLLKFGGKYMPKTFPKLMKKVLKSAKLSIFNDALED